MTTTPYTETVTPQELSGEHIGIMATATTADGTGGEIGATGPVTNIDFDTFVYRNGGSGEPTISIRGAYVEIGYIMFPLEDTRFHYDAAGIRTRRNWHPNLPDWYVERVRAWEAKQTEAGKEAETVTIDRDVYDVLVLAYKAHDAGLRASHARAEVPMLHPDQVAELDQH